MPGRRGGKAGLSYRADPHGVVCVSTDEVLSRQTVLAGYNLARRLQGVRGAAYRQRVEQIGWRITATVDPESCWS